MGCTRLILALSVLSFIAHAQQPASAPSPPSISSEADSAPLPNVRQLLLDVERNEKAAEAIRKNYTYHVHFEQQELDGKGRPKKLTAIDSESLTVDTVRVNRTVARDGRPLTPDEQAKESERIDKEVARDKARRDKKEDKGQDTNSRGDDIISAARILELGTFSNPRRITLNGRSTIVLDYAGDPNAKTHNSFEGVVRDLVGTVWIDEKDRVLVQAQGHFLNDFKIGAGLVADVKKDSSFSAHWAHINDEVWLPTVVDGQGKVRILLVTGFTGRIHLVTSDYRKFRTSATIVSGGDQVDADGNPIPNSTKPDSPKPPKP
jgi:hypothetical protein